MTLTDLPTHYLQCKSCDFSFDAPLAAIINATKQVATFQRLVKGTQHDVLCPNCGLPQQVNTPFLLINSNANASLVYCAAYGAGQSRENSDRIQLLSILENMKISGQYREESYTTPVTVNRNSLRSLFKKQAKRQSIDGLNAIVAALTFAQIQGELENFLSASKENLPRIRVVFARLIDEISQPDVPKNPEMLFDLSWTYGILCRCEKIGIRATFAERFPS